MCNSNEYVTSVSVLSPRLWIFGGLVNLRKIVSKLSKCEAVCTTGAIY